MIQPVFIGYCSRPVPLPPRDSAGEPIICDGETTFAIEQAVTHFGISDSTLRQLYADAIGPLLTDEDSAALGIVARRAPAVPAPAWAHRPVVGPDDLRVLRASFCQGIREHEFELFVKMCNRTALDPFTRQIYHAYRPDRRSGQLVFSVEIGIAGLRLLATRTGEIAGTKGPFFSGDGKAWVRAWNEPHQPTFARFAVKRKGREEHQWAVADWDSYVQTVRGEQTDAEHVDYTWMKFGYLCLARCAEALAWRMVFPEIGVLYTPDEMAQSSNPVPAPKPSPDVPPAADDASQPAPDDAGSTQLIEPAANTFPPPRRSQRPQIVRMPKMMRASELTAPTH